ncbi:MAG: TMEM175 family protein [Cyclobacteriaceae bacterium]|jgi:uncharacterized membrane protein|nr:TMEM175 family protein [Cyclobacteriaceae bacterium]
MYKEKLPADRVVFFSDAVFAIAMTLLVLEIKLPSAEELNQFTIAQILEKRIPNFIAFTISFLVTALFWRAHVVICKGLKEVSDRFLWIDIFLLGFVVLMPFSTALFANFGYGSNMAFVFYSLNLAAIGLFHLWLTVHVHSLIPAENEAQKLMQKNQVLRASIVVFVFICAACLSSVLPVLSRYLFFLIFAFQKLADWRYKKRLKLLQPQPEIQSTENL